MKKRGASLIEVLIVVALLAIVAAAAASGCTGDRDGARGALQGMGFKDITLSDPQWFFSGCSENETNNPFTATNPAGQRVHGVVCCGGWLSAKGCTVRF